jgi:hypothetical protein
LPEESVPSDAQEGEYSEHSSVDVPRLGQFDLREDLRNVRFYGALGDEQASGDGPVGHALGDEPEHLSLTLGELSEGILAPPSTQQARHDGRIDDSLPLADPPQRVDDRGDVEDTLL